MAEMSDDQLIGYCEIHCETEVALFSPEQINRMLALAGHPEGYVHSVDRWLSVGSEMRHLCELARARQAQNSAKGSETA